VKESKEGGTSEEAKHSSDVIRKKDIHAERERSRRDCDSHRLAIQLRIY